MGRIFLIEKDEPAYTCAQCNAQKASESKLREDWAGNHEFNELYNVVKDSNEINYSGHHLDWGHEVSCVNCGYVIGWHDAEKNIFLLPHARVNQPQENPPQLVNPAAPQPVNPAPPQIPSPPQTPPPPEDPAPEENPPLPEGSPPEDPAPEENPPLPEGPPPVGSPPPDVQP